jgi:hypothetical protein
MSTSRGPSISAVAWIVLFVAIAGRLPALASFFAQDDFGFLARAAGHAEVDGWPVRPLSTVLYWKIMWSSFGLDAPAYHGFALLLAGAQAVLTLRIGMRLGLGLAGGTVAGLICAASPAVVLPIAWASATAELLAAVLALAALDLWLRGGSLITPFLAAVLALSSLLAKESALGAPGLLALAMGWYVPEEPHPLRRGRWLLLGLLLLVSTAIGLQVWRAFPHGEGTPYELGGARVVGANLLTLGGWLLSPVRFSPPDLWSLRALGLIGWLAWVAFALRRWGRGQRDVAFALAWALASLAPVLGLRHHLYPYYVLPAVAPLGWSLGIAAQEAWNRWGPRTEGSPRAALSLVATSLLVAVLAWSATRDRMTRRLEDGRIADPILRRSGIAAQVHRTLTDLLRAQPVVEVAVLQATTVEVPEELELPAAGAVFVQSPVFASLGGFRGLPVLLPPGVRGRWVGELDGLDPDAQVLLDSGQPFLHVLGPVENARLYSALIAVSAGQYERGRHDLWSVAGPIGSRVRFAYRADSLPIEPEHLDAEAPGFVRYLMETPSPESGRILRLFEQLYEAVRERKLFDEPWGEPIGERYR